MSTSFSNSKVVLLYDQALVIVCSCVYLKGVCHEIFYHHFFSWLEPIWAPDKEAKVFLNSVSISPRYSITNCFLQIFSFMIDVFSPKRIFPDCPFKSNQGLTKISILTSWCAVWLRGVMHTMELNSVVWCTPWSLTPWCDAHHGA